MTYSIGEISARTGVKPVTLRAWETRYGIVRPTRTASAYRQYSEQDLEVLRHMSSLIASGMPARQAADLARGSDRSRRATGMVRGLIGLTDHAAITRAASRLDGVAVRQILDQAFALAAPEVVIDTWLMPSMRNVGEAWANGSLDVVSEHFISSAVMRKLSALFEATAAHGPRVVVGLPQAAAHELPALAFSLLLQRAGTQVLYVGADVPTASWSALLEVWRPQAAVLGVLSMADVQPASAAVDALRSGGLRRVYVGGDAGSHVQHARPLPHSLREASTVVAAAVKRGLS